MPRQQNFGPGPYEGPPVTGGNRLPSKANATSSDQDSFTRLWCVTRTGIVAGNAAPYGYGIVDALLQATPGGNGSLSATGIYKLSDNLQSIRFLDAEWVDSTTFAQASLTTLAFSGYRLYLKNQLVVDYQPFAFLTPNVATIASIQLLNDQYNLTFDSIQFVWDNSNGSSAKLFIGRFMTSQARQVCVPVQTTAEAAA